MYVFPLTSQTLFPILRAVRKVPAGHVEVSVKSFALFNPADRNLPYDPEDNLNLVRPLL